MLLSLPVPTAPWEALPLHVASRLAIVRSDYARTRLPQLEERFTALTLLQRMNIVASAPAPYFVPAVLGFISEANGWRIGEQAGQLLVQHAPFLTGENLEAALTAWANNSQCREAAQMPDLAVALFRSAVWCCAPMGRDFTSPEGLRPRTPRSRSP
jgi:hypothetical protein